MKQVSMRIVPVTVSTSLKNETENHEDGSFTMSTSLKNETGIHEHSSFSCVKLIKK